MDPVQIALEYGDYLQERERKGNKPLPKAAWQKQDMVKHRWWGDIYSMYSGLRFKVPFFDDPEEPPVMPRTTIPGHVRVVLSGTERRVRVETAEPVLMRWKDGDRGVIEYVPSHAVDGPVSWRAEYLLDRFPHVQLLVERLMEYQALAEEEGKTGHNLCIARLVVLQARRQIDAVLRIQGVWDEFPK